MGAWPYPFWIAHRGAGRLAPENTLAAFRVGAAHGYRAFECDVKLSADGVPFLLHDATLDRTTSGTGTAASHDWSALSRLDAGRWHGRGFAGEPPPSLGAIAAYCQRNGHALNIEIKPTPGDESRTGRVVAAEAARLWAGRALPPLLSSFSAEALRSAREAAGHLPRALLVETLDGIGGIDGLGAPGAPGGPGGNAFDTAGALGCVAVVTRHDQMQAAVVARLHAAGLRALVYTVNEADEAERLIALRIDGIITDAVDRFSPAGPG